MIAKIIISANEDETRMGLLENGILMEYLVERLDVDRLVVHHQQAWALGWHGQIAKYGGLVGWCHGINLCCKWVTWSRAAVKSS